MVKDHSDSEKKTPLHGLLCPVSRKESFICTISQDSTHHCLFYTSCGALAEMRNSSVGPP